MKGSRVIHQDKIANVLVTRTAIKTLKPESIVEKVVNFQLKDAVAATKRHNEVEISGFGKIYVSKAKAKKKTSILNRALTNLDVKIEKADDDLKRAALNIRRESVIEALVHLKARNV